MTFDKKTLFSVLIGFDLLANILELAHVNFLGTTTFMSFCTSILLPGFLLSLILRIGKISFWENLLIVVGLSIAFLEFGGLLLNILLPLFGVNDPLAFQNLFFGFNIYTLLLFIFAWLRTKPFVSQIQFPKHSSIEKTLYILPIFFPILATLGAIILNNGGNNILTLILLGSIVFYSLLLVVFRGKISSEIYPYAIFFIAVASLFTTSLRGWYITGHDVEVEYYIFKLTNTYHIWNMAFFRDPYNACLSITILPTILTNLLFIQDMYIYKVIFQILFAIVPVLVFFILKPYTTPILAFLSAFLFMSFPTFFTDMAMLNRQEIGFIFFGLVLYVMLKRKQTQQFYIKSGTLSLSALPVDLSESETLSLSALPVDLSKSETLSLSSLPRELSLSKRRILFIIFALSVIISHYSTNFVLVMLVAFVYVSTIIISRLFVKNTFASLLSKTHIKPKSTFTNQVFLSLPLVLILFGGTYLWNNLYTHSSGNVGSVLAEVVSSVFVTSNANKSSDLSVSIFFAAAKQDPQQEFRDYIQNITQEAQSANSGQANVNPFYSKSITNKYPTSQLPQYQLPPTPLGNLLSSFHIQVFNINAELRLLAAYFMQIFVLVGLLAIFLVKNKKPFDLQFLLLCFAALFLLALITVLPALSVEYGVLRMFQQFLFILSLPIVLGLNLVFFFIKEQKRILFIGITIFILFFDLTGFISNITGDYYPQLTLSNSGVYYDAYYVHQSDVIAITWLAKNDTNNGLVQADSSGVNKLLPYGGIKVLSEIFPAVIRKDTYVYLEVSNHVEVSIDRSLLIYTSPKSFLDDNKNLVYSNGKNDIYK